jgi:excisionase family DNA binding protein
MPVRFPVLMPNGAIQDQDCLTVSELAAELLTTRDSVYRKIRSGEWPYYKVVRRVYFTPEHVRAILSMSEHRPSGMPSQQEAHTRGNVRKLGS